MSFGHERLDVYQAAIEYVGWAYHLCERLKGQRSAKEQLLRASQAIPLNIAEGNGKATDGDRRRYFEIARASALECGAIQDVLEVCGALSAEENTEAKAVLDRIVAMLTKLGRRGHAVREEPAENFVVGSEGDDVSFGTSDLTSTAWRRGLGSNTLRWESIPMPIAIPTPRGRETEQRLPTDAPKGAPLKHGVSGVRTTRSDKLEPHRSILEVQLCRIGLTR
jgi:four helix bundle protein